MDYLVYQSDAAFLRKIWTLPEEELVLRCPVCHARVLFAPTWERARRLGVHPGTHCSADRKHLMVLFELDAEPSP
ncbi:hypothetical protein [Luteolibacter sp. LG18]|uniref:hypothetical protein n=1 Tax=Luteolibacter sp. LG18 TaxID=2819286 RepID=UPI002B2F25D3|nr:hypothetical protein llg_27240 [Luteolibacter sp. LG18]